MLKIGMHMTIITLWENGKSKSEISRITGHDRKTVSRIIKNYEETGNISPNRTIKQSKLDKYKEEILEYLEKGLTALRIHEELSKKGYQIKYRTLCYYISGFKKKEDICVRFHTLAGEEAQVDFGDIGKIPDISGKLRRGWIFNMRLSYSRLDYYETVYDQSVETFIKCHINALHYFRGVTEIVKIDNLKAAILEASFYEPIYQRLFKSFADHNGFKIVPCRVRKPREKGKVESGIKYIKNNFFAGRKFKDYDEMQKELGLWLEKANSRVHRTTKKVPKELFLQEEKIKLKKLPILDFVMPIIMTRKVYRDCHITVDSNYYSVPYEYVGKIVEIQKDSKLLRIYYMGKQVATHIQGDRRGEFITQESHYPKYKYYTASSEEYRIMYKNKMELIGENSSKIFDLIVENEPYGWYRIIKGILSLRKLFSNEVLELSCKRALSFKITSYRKIKSICNSGSYNLPIEDGSDYEAA